MCCQNQTEITKKWVNKEMIDLIVDFGPEVAADVTTAGILNKQFPRLPCSIWAPRAPRGVGRRGARVGCRNRRLCLLQLAAQVLDQALQLLQPLRNLDSSRSSTVIMSGMMLM